MARTIKQIQDSIIAAKEADVTVGVRLTSTSAVAVWLMWTYIVAFCQHVLETLFDLHKAEITGILSVMKPHTPGWYVMKVKAFQEGYELPDNSDVYETIDADAQIVKYAAYREVAPYLYLKIAKDNAGEIAPLTSDQQSAVGSYIRQIKDAGCRVRITSYNPDDLQASFIIYYDAMVLGTDGARLDGTADTPVLDALKAFVRALPFDGLFVKNKLIRYIEDNVPGVRICMPDTIQARYGLLPYAPIVTEYNPDAGYLNVDEDFFTTYTTYVAHSPL